MHHGHFFSSLHHVTSTQKQVHHKLLHHVDTLWRHHVTSKQKLVHPKLLHHVDTLWRPYKRSLISNIFLSQRQIPNETEVVLTALILLCLLSHRLQQHPYNIQQGTTDIGIPSPGVPGTVSWCSQRVYSSNVGCSASSSPVSLWKRKKIITRPRKDKMAFALTRRHEWLILKTFLRVNGAPP